MAYVQLLRRHVHVCNAVMMFAELERQGSLASRVIIYPKKWNRRVEGQTVFDRSRGTSIRLLQMAAKRYKVVLLPVEPVLQVNEG